jgi:rare lipoprotein A
VVRITDRGPFIEGRIIDVSRVAASELGVSGLTQVCINIQWIPEGIIWVPESRAVGEN